MTGSRLQMGRKDEKSSSVLSGATIPMIVSNERQPMIPYSCLVVIMVIIAPSVVVFETLAK